MKVLMVFGTRPEAIKMAPLYFSLKTDSRINTKICVTGQHREMLDQVLSIFRIVPDYDLNLMKENQGLDGLTGNILANLTPILKDYEPNLVLVHGDTTTTMAAALASYYLRIPVYHVEAGLRTGNLYSPWPEEGNRKLVASVASRHYCPTERAQQNLIDEGCAKSTTLVTGNTVVDALYFIKNTILSKESEKSYYDKYFNYIPPGTEIVLITGHRRENFGAGFLGICTAISKLAREFPRVSFVYPVHLNPNVKNPVESLLSGLKNVFLIEPQDYVPFVYLMDRCKLILTDSGGIQEEAPSLGKPVLVMRNHTERPEAVLAGTVILVGSDPDEIYYQTSSLLKDTKKYHKMSHAHNPYGDGRASELILSDIQKLL